MVGLPFSRDRWRNFYKRNQIFVTLCMECAYIENLRNVKIKAEDKAWLAELQQHAIKTMGQHKEYVDKMVREPHVRGIVLHWINIARANVLHKYHPKAKRDESFEIGKIHEEDDRGIVEVSASEMNSSEEEEMKEAKDHFKRMGR